MPYLSPETLDFHHGKHHQTYIDNLNKLIDGTVLADKSLEEIILASAKEVAMTGVFNNAAQVWNHSFYWNCLKPNGGGIPTGRIAGMLSARWGSFEKFVEEFKNAALTQFGSGWGWLVLEQGSLAITKTSNADTPLASGRKALLTVDVWEHAYYIDYRNRRGDYLTAFMEKLVNWDFVNSLL